MPTVRDQQQLIDLLATTDETLVVQAIEAAAKQRAKDGLGQDIIDALKKKGIAILETPLEKPWYQSKKFWAGVIATIVLVADEFVGAELWKIAAPPLVYIFGQGLADFGKNKAQS